MFKDYGVALVDFLTNISKSLQIKRSSLFLPDSLVTKKKSFMKLVWGFVAMWPETFKPTDLVGAQHLSEL